VRGSDSSGRSTRCPRPSRSGSGGAEPLERALLAEELEALEQPRRHLRARDGEPDRRERVARLQIQLLGELTERRLDRLGGERLDLAERSLGLLDERRVELVPVERDVAEQEPRERGKVAELLDFLLHQ